MKIIFAILFLGASSLISKNNTSSLENNSTDVTRLEIKIPAKKKAKVKFRKTMLAFEANYEIEKTYS